MTELKNAQKLRDKFRELAMEHANDISVARKNYDLRRPRKPDDIKAEFVLNVMRTEDWSLGSVGIAFSGEPLDRLANDVTVKKLRDIFAQCQADGGLTSATYAALVDEVTRVFTSSSSPYANRIACYFDHRLGWLLCLNRMESLIHEMKKHEIVDLTASLGKKWFELQMIVMPVLHELLGSGYDDVTIAFLMWMILDWLEHKK